MNYTVGAYILNHNGVWYTFTPFFYTVYREDAERRMVEIADFIMLHGYLAFGDCLYLKDKIHSLAIKEASP